MKTELLTLLRETDGYVSGQELCEKFGVSRTAVTETETTKNATGYIKSEYLSAAAPESTSETAAAGSLAEGTVIELSNTTNIRSTMSETADKVGVAYSGEKVTVVMSYAEGWTKVTWKNKTGYIKTDLLK